jgi:hypothetical protein
MNSIPASAMATDPNDFNPGIGRVNPLIARRSTSTIPYSTIQMLCLSQLNTEFRCDMFIPRASPSQRIGSLWAISNSKYKALSFTFFKL